MKNTKRIIAAVLAILMCLSSMVALSACRVKDETILTFKSGDQTYDIKAGIYLCNLLSAYNQFRTEYGTAVEKASSTTAADVDYEKQTLENKDYTTWIKDKTYELCAQYAYTEMEFERLGLEITSEQNDTVENYASANWATGYGSIYTENGVSYNTYRQFFLNQQFKFGMIYNYYYGEFTADEKKADKNKGSLRPADSEIKTELKKNYVIADTISESLTKKEDNSSNVISLTDDEKKAAKAKLLKYADRINNGESFSKIYIEHNGSDKQADTSSTSQPKDKYATVYGGPNTSNNSSYFEDVNKQTVGKAVVLEFSDCYMLVVKQDILKDSYYFDSYKTAVVQIMKFDGFESDFDAKAAKLEATVKNTDAINYYKPQRVKLETATAAATTAA